MLFGSVSFVAFILRLLQSGRLWCQYKTTLLYRLWLSLCVPMAAVRSGPVGHCKLPFVHLLTAARGGVEIPGLADRLKVLKPDKRTFTQLANPC